MPMGGMIMPSSTITTLMMPHHTGSKPQLLISGSTKGSVITIAATSSNTAPSTRYISISSASTTGIDSPDCAMAAIMASGACEMATK